MTEIRMAEAKQIFEIMSTERKTKLTTSYIFKKIRVIAYMNVEVTISTGVEIENNHEQLLYIIRCRNIREVNREDNNLIGNYILYQSVVFNDEKEFDIVLLQKLLDDLHDKIELMKLDKTFGKLITENCEEDFDEYIGGEECCVCFHKTITLTDCKHPLCIACWDKMYASELYKCPICKSNHMMVFSGDSDDEDN
jgi:hypothetical protein